MKDLMRTHAALLFVGVATFVMMGAGQALFGPALPVYVRDFALGQGEAGLFVALLWVGCFLGVGVMYFKGAGIGPRPTLAAMAAGTGLMAVSPNWVLTLLGGALFGVGYGMATAVFNPRVMRAFGAKGPSMLSLLNATFGVGAIAAPLVFVWLGSDPAVTFGVVAVVLAVIWALAGSAGRDAVAQTGPVKAFRPHWGILAFGALAIGMEASLAGLGPTALIRAGVEETRASELLSLFFVVFLLARVVLIFIAHRVEPFVLYTLSIGSAAVFALGAAVWSPAVCFVAMGASAGVFFPGYYVTASAKMGEDIRVPPTIVASGLVGAIVTPLVLAPLVAGMGDRGFFWVSAALLGTATVAALLALRRMKV
ncbi:MAG: MFS transporter [Tabrizicola sp.]|uniref:MFS transporter n=1 Tax=Tabrizicola sp. TaxID=2005166 RepID=UPI002ABA0F73|nr:MFS transporter [Tabrizicola sp.]MDZ4087068.1 MFS transporter [Tabrizicola sp.]